jgi:hypothetical protein
MRRAISNSNGGGGMGGASASSYFDDESIFGVTAAATSSTATAADSAGAMASPSGDSDAPVLTIAQFAEFLIACQRRRLDVDRRPDFLRRW